MIRLVFSAAGILLFGFLPHQVVAQDDHPGREKYQLVCAPCHGSDLNGGMGPSLIDGEWLHGSSRNQIFRSVSEGISGSGMPAFGGALSDEEINQVVDFIMEGAAGEEMAASTTPSAIYDDLETLDYRVSVEVFADSLEIPWAIDFLDERTALITERPGRLRVVKDGRLDPDPVSGIPQVLHEGQGGLMDVTVDPEYDQNGWIYISYSHVLPGGADGRPPAMTRIVRGKLRDNTWTDQQVVFEAPHEMYRTTRHHYGSRIVFDREGYLYFSIGDRGAGEQAQDLGRPNGKIHRIHRDGSIPEDNPFVNREDALPSVFSYGHRNPQGLAIDRRAGTIWEVEHGPRGGDELNRVEAGRNYGWPVISYGINYDGTILTEYRRRMGMEQPVLYWRPSIAVSGLSIYERDLFPYWRGHLLVGALNYEEVRLLDVVDGRVMHDEVILKDAGRVREAVTGPDGAIYVVLNDPDRILRLTPAGTSISRASD